MTQRFFEEITVGEELPTVERVPTEELIVRFFTRVNEPPPTLERIPVATAGFSGVIVPGLLKVAWLGQYVVEWAGPESTFRTSRVSYKRPDPAGQPLFLTGTVVDKREEDGRGIVEVEAAAGGAEGPSVRGMVQVEVPRRGA